MNVADVQKSKLIDALHEEATSRGLTLHKFQLADMLAEFYKYRSAGQPASMPLLQEPRREFDLVGYNLFMQQVDFDIDVLMSYLSQARISARDLLVVNDVKMKEFNQRIDAIHTQVAHFQDSPVTDNRAIFEKTIDIPVRYFNPIVPTLHEACSVESNYSIVTLGELEGESKDIDIQVALESWSKFQILLDPRQIREHKTESAPVSMANTNPQPWLERIVTDKAQANLSSVFTMELPVLEEINKITFDPIPGMSASYTISVSSAGNNFIVVGRFPDSRTGKAVTFAPKKVKKVKIEIKVRQNMEENGKSIFIVGLRSLKLSRKVYLPAGTIVISDIDPDIQDRRIISANLKVDQELPNGTDSQFFISLNNTTKNNPLLEINGKENDDSDVNFKITQSQEIDLAYVSRVEYTRRNNLRFDKLAFKNSNNQPLVLDANRNSYLPRITELWIEQNAFKEMKQFDASTVEVQDAFVLPTEVRKQVPVYVPLTLDRLSLRESGSDYFLELPLPVAAYTKATLTATETATDAMKEGTVHGLYRVEVYKSTDTTKSTDITNLCTVRSDYSIKVTPFAIDPDSMYRVYYIGKLTQEGYVKQETVKAHFSYGTNGALDDQQIHRTKNKYVFTEANQFYATDQGTDLLGKRVYLNLVMIINIVRLNLYETYITIPEYSTNVILTAPLYADRQSGEYITIRDLATGDLTRLDGVQVLNNLEAGRYLLSVMSKPKSIQKSSIKSILEAQIQPRNANDVVFKKLFDMRESPVISKISVREEQLVHRELTSLLNNSKKIGENTFSTAVVDGALEFIIPEAGYSILNIGDSEMYKLNLQFFDENLYQDDVHTRLHIKMRLNSNNSGPTTITPSVRGLQLRVKYI